MWNWDEWQRDFGHPEEDLFENVGFALIPAGSDNGTPNQLGQPQAYMITAASRKKELAALLIMLASDVDLNTNHALEGAKLAIRQSQTAFPRFAESEYLSRAATLVPDQIFLPSHPASGFYNTALYEAIGGVEAGMLTPEKALQQLEMPSAAAAGRRLDRPVTTRGGARRGVRPRAAALFRFPLGGRPSCPGNLGSCRPVAAAVLAITVVFYFVPAVMTAAMSFTDMDFRLQLELRRLRQLQAHGARFSAAPHPAKHRRLHVLDAGLFQRGLGGAPGAGHVVRARTGRPGVPGAVAAAPLYPAHRVRHHLDVDSGSDPERAAQQPLALAGGAARQLDDRVPDGHHRDHQRHHRRCPSA